MFRLIITTVLQLRNLHGKLYGRCVGADRSRNDSTFDDVLDCAEFGEGDMASACFSGYDWPQSFSEAPKVRALD